ncbi:hypothetical protein GGS23DRAFT_231597 [Durotheca rogersii]|uniref:uncharacterized protein n=1 Tax=Durotheca rogersii TaxID=419775 RepID=UPI00221EAC97|nr:uncharacterized protein GGS23DRAFT_231597 [Durotheca rogersii]KAI5860605.1 hypothetical protein GGS23DRAFT_231597 [Durotheca rogersii]
MPIPQAGHVKPDTFLAPPVAEAGASQSPVPELTTHLDIPFTAESISILVRRTFSRSLDASSIVLARAADLHRRSADVNTTIGVVVGILLAVFLAAAGSFMYFYGRSIRTGRRRNRRRRSAASRGSKLEEGGAPPGDAPPPE